MQSISTIGLDIAKSVFQVHGVDAAGQVVLRRQLRRRHVLAFFQKLPPCLVVIEACASSHHWSRELQAYHSWAHLKHFAKTVSLLFIVLFETPLATAPALYCSTWFPLISFKAIGPKNGTKFAVSIFCFAYCSENLLFAITYCSNHCDENFSNVRFSSVQVRPFPIDLPRANFCRITISNA